MTFHLEMEMEILSDNSEVYNIKLWNATKELTFRAVTLEDALDLQEGLHQLINKHTNEKAVTL